MVKGMQLPKKESKAIIVIGHQYPSVEGGDGRFTASRPYLNYLLSEGSVQS